MLHPKKILLVIDIGSNAMRATFFKKNDNGFQNLLNKRYPLRLGQEVYTQSQISAEKQTQLLDAMQELWTICYRHKIKNVVAVATAAMREARNRNIILKKIFSLTGIKVQLISGALEARIIFEAVKKSFELKKKCIAHMDIGGGSTEIIISDHGKIRSVQSLPLGSVLLLQCQKLTAVEKKIQQITSQTLKKSALKDVEYILGTGGNFKSILKVRDILFPGEKNKEISLNQVEHLYQRLTQIDYYQRMRQFDLKADRADVIIPAICLVHFMMQQFKIKKLVVLEVGLEDGLLHLEKKLKD